MKFKNILFIIDEIEFKYFELNKLVTNFWLIYEFLSRGYNVLITTKNKLFIKNAKACAVCWKSYIKDDDILKTQESEELELEGFDVIFFRSDPPVDVDYVNACHILDMVDENKTLVINKPSAVLCKNEKLYVNEFPSVVPENIVSADENVIKKFLKDKGEIIIKPLNRCFSSGVFYLNTEDKNINAILATATENFKTQVMVQEFLPDIKYGDKRLIFICGEILEYTVQKLGTDDFKFNQHTDSNFKKAPVTKEEKALEGVIGKKLMNDGIYIAGLDTISAKIIEINVTSPCFFIKEINNFYNIELHKIIVDKLENFIIQKKKLNQLV
ncbi:hypothetical protein IKA15_02645 [bacterium]|nr:hypothetical protein [bacterium]